MEQQVRGGVTGADRYSVLLICHSYPPVLGGSEIEAQRVCAGLIRRGHRVQVLCAGEPGMPPVKRWVDPEGVPVRIFGSRRWSRLRGYAFAFGAAWTVARARKHCDVVYFLMSGLQIATAMPVARLFGIPILMKFSGSSVVLQMTGSALARLELGFIRKWAGRILVLNPGMIEEARSVDLDLRRVGLMPNPVDTSDFRPVDPVRKADLRAALGLPASAPLIVFSGRLAPEKELASLLGAFSEVAGARADAWLGVVGDGPLRGALEERARELGIAGRVVFTGRVAPSRVREWLQAADAYALVSSIEGLPCSLIEAMAAGLPSVVSDIPANIQVIRDGCEGLIVPVRSEPAIAAALLRLVSDSALAGRLAGNARDRAVALYSTGTVIEQYERLFAELARPRR